MRGGVEGSREPGWSSSEHSIRFAAAPGVSAAARQLVDAQSASTDLGVPLDVQERVRTVRADAAF